MRFPRFDTALGLFVAELVFATSPLAGQNIGEWTAYGHDALGGRFSPLTQIARENVAQLKPA